MRYRVEIDGALCSGFGTCVAAAPSVFELERKAVVATVLAATTDDEQAIEAAETCPMGALSIFDAANGDRVV